MAGPRLFISYRRADAADIVRAIRERLAREYGDDAVFLDVDTLGAGELFRSGALGALRAAEVVLVVVGPDWAGPDGSGGRRIDDPQDLVRNEVETALREGKRVVPILVRGAPIPPRESLPGPLQGLFDHNAVRIDADGFAASMGRVLRAIDPGRARRRRIIGVLAAAGVVALGAVAFVLADSPPAPFTLVVRVHGPDGPASAVGPGRVVLEAGGVRYTAELSTAGEAVYARLPAEVAGDSATLIPLVDGFESEGRRVQLPSEGTLDLALQPRALRTQLRGLLLDTRDAPVAGAIVDVDYGSGSAVDTTDERGAFGVTLPVAVGTRVLIRVTRDSIVGHFDPHQVPARSLLTLRFQPGDVP